MELIKEKGFNGRIVNYLVDDVSKTEIELIFSKYKGNPLDLVRKDDLRKLTENSVIDLPENELIEFVFNNIKVLQRPILVSNEESVVGRPTENLLTLF